MKKLIITLVVVVLIVVGALPALATPSPEVCPRDTDGWSSEQKPPLGDVGADEYCVKGGSAKAEGCEGYLETGSFSEVSNVVNGDGACGLSHWTYRNTEEPTNTPVTPADTPTEVTPTATDVTHTPTAVTNTPTAVTTTATPENTNTPETTNTPTPQAPPTCVPENNPIPGSQCSGGTG